MTTVERVTRAFRERLYLVEHARPALDGKMQRFVIQGSRDSAYEVLIPTLETALLPNPANDVDDDDFSAPASAKNPFAPHCECMDHVSRGSMCKHIVFVLLRVIKLRDVNDKRLECLHLSQEALTRITSPFLPVARVDVRAPTSRDEADRMAQEVENTNRDEHYVQHYTNRIHEIVARFRVAVASSPQAIYDDDDDDDDDVLDGGGRECEHEVQQRDYAGMACPVCMDELEANATEGQSIVWCRLSCGQSLHSECQQRWMQRSQTCPYCRHAWR